MPRTEPRPVPVSILVVLLALAAAAELIRPLLGLPWPIDVETISHLVSLFLTALWLTTAAAFVLRHRSPRAATVAWILSILAPASMVIHGLFVSRLGATIGLLYLPAAATLAFLARRTLGRGELHRLRQEARAKEGTKPSPSATR